MRESDKPIFGAILTGMAQLKPGGKLTAEALELFWNAMAHWTIEEFQAAANQLVRTSEFMPNPFHFEQLRKAGRLTAGEAFDRARAHARELPVSGGFVRDLPLGNGVIDAAVRACGGWRVFTNATSEGLPFLERRFAEHFDSITDAEDTRIALPDLTGGTKLLDGPTNGPKLLRSL